MPNSAKSKLNKGLMIPNPMPTFSLKIQLFHNGEVPLNKMTRGMDSLLYLNNALGKVITLRQF